VFQLPMSWLNAEAELNIDLIVVTCAVFQLPMSWLNAEARLNVDLMEVTFPVFHFEISALNVLLPPKPLYELISVYPLISVTKLTSQFGIAPCAPYLSHEVHIPSTGAIAKHSATYACQFASRIGSGNVHVFAGPSFAFAHANFVRNEVAA